MNIFPPILPFQNLEGKGEKHKGSYMAGYFSLFHVQTSSGAHAPSYPMGTNGSFPEGKAAGA